MEINYSAETQDIDKPAFEAQAERPDKPLRIRVQPTLLRIKPGSETGSHQAWPGVSWTLECKDAEEAIAVREGLRLFFSVVATFGPIAVQQDLTTLLSKQ